MAIKEQLEAKNTDTKKNDKEINTEKFFDAVQSGDCDKIRYFIHSGIDINVRDDEGQSALMKAAFVNADEVATILIRSGADINVKDNQGQTPFMMAALSDSKAVAETLAEFGADVDAVDNQGNKALDIAGLSFVKFFRDRAIREKSNFKRIRDILDSYHNFKNYGIIRGFKDVYKKKYGHDLYTPYLDSYLKDFNSEKNDKILMVIGEDEIQVIPSKVAIQDFLNLEFASKNYGYKSDVQTKFLERYKYELEDRILKDFIRVFNDKNTDRILNKLDDGTIQVIPSKVTIQQFLNSEFANKDFGYKSDIRTKFLERYKYELEDDILRNFIRGFTDKNTDRILNELDDGTIQLASIKEMVQQFLDYEFANKDYGYKSDVRSMFLEKYHCELTGVIISRFITNFNEKCADKILDELGDGRIQVEPSNEIVHQFLSSEFANKDYGYKSDVRAKFLEKYNCELADDVISDFCINFNDKYTDKILDELGDGRIQVEPSNEIVHQFLSSEFANKDYGYKIDVRSMFLEKYHCELEDRILKNFIKVFNDKNTDRILNKLNDGRIQVAPSNEIVQQFLSSEFTNKDYGYEIDVRSMFLEKYHCELEDRILKNFIKVFNDKNTDRILNKLNDGRIQVAPSNEIVQQFLSSEFIDKDYGCVNDVRTKFWEKYQCAFSENFLDEFIIFFNRCFSGKILKKMKDGKIQVVPSKENAIRFLSDEFANKDYGYITDVRTRFLEKYHCELANEVLLDFIIEFTERDTNKRLKKLEEGKVRIEPSYNEIRKFLLREFEEQPENEIDKKEVFENFKTKYKCDLNNSDLEICMDSFNSSLDNRVIIRKDNSYQIAKIISFSVEELSSIAIKMRKFFLAEDVGDSYSIEEIKKELECEHVSDREVELASAIANTKLKDINIISESNGNIKSTFKTAGMSSGIFNMSVCPVCGKSFSKCDNNIDKRNHMLECHSSEEKNCAFFTKTGKTGQYARFTYLCSHCNQELEFYDDNVLIIYMHLLGECKKSKKYPQKLNYKPIGGGNMHNTVWKGAAYANGDAFLGNSGQLLREDNGRFGSYPLEDNYGGGD